MTITMSKTLCCPQEKQVTKITVFIKPTTHGSEQRKWNEEIRLKEKLDMCIDNDDIQ